MVYALRKSFHEEKNELVKVNVFKLAFSEKKIFMCKNVAFSIFVCLENKRINGSDCKRTMSVTIYCGQSCQLSRYNQRDLSGKTMVTVAIHLATLIVDQRCVGHDISMPRGIRPVGLASPSRLVPQLIFRNVTRGRPTPFILHLVPLDLA
jgi:hypothetical protein